MEKAINNFWKEQFKQLQPFVDSMDNTEYCQQPDDSGDAQFAKANISRENRHPQGEKGEAVEQIQNEVSGHQQTCLSDFCRTISIFQGSVRGISWVPTPVKCWLTLINDVDLNIST